MSAPRPSATALISPLPKLKDGNHEVIRFQIAEDDNAHSQTKTKREIGEPIAVPALLDSPHPLIAQILNEAAKAKDGKDHMSMNRRRALDIRVTSGSFGRAACLMDALMKASEARGHVWRITPDGQTSDGVNDGPCISSSMRRAAHQRHLHLSGFGSNDPGRNRDKSRLKDDHSVSLYPIDLELPITHRFESFPISEADLLKFLKEELAYTIRYQNAGGSSWKSHPHLEAFVIMITAATNTVRELLCQASS